MYTLSKMRDDVCRVYDYRPGWVAKVNAMSTGQLIAVWQRFKAQGFDPEVIKRGGAASRTTLAKLQEAPRECGTTYYCGDCRSTFVADNPELNECRFCGSYKLERWNQT